MNGSQGIPTGKRSHSQADIIEENQDDAHDWNTGWTVSGEGQIEGDWELERERKELLGLFFFNSLCCFGFSFIT